MDSVRSTPLKTILNTACSDCCASLHLKTLQVPGTGPAVGKAKGQTQFFPTAEKKCSTANSYWDSPKGGRRTTLALAVNEENTVGQLAEKMGIWL